VTTDENHNIPNN